ncbi:hypothetical protein ACW66K_06840 [Aerococcus urinaeequi]
MGQVFSEREKKVANSLTVVEMVKEHDAEIKALMTENRKKSIEAEKAKKAKLFARENINRLNVAIRYKPTEAKQAELEAYKRMLEVLK